ncbi:MAG: co-chaperone GroES family protein [Bacteroidota bacterium]
MPLESLLVVGDRVLVRPEEADSQTQAGLYLPASVRAKQRVQAGRVVKTGPGHMMPNPEFSDAEPWAPERPAVRYLPLQAEPGDLALFLQEKAIELEYDGEQYLILPHEAILALVRPDASPSLEDLF